MLKALRLVTVVLSVLLLASPTAPGQPVNMQRLNVLKTPLKQFSTSPMTGFFRDGYCLATPLDPGHHAVAGVITDEFLDFTGARGNDLRRGGGLTAGCRWCLCTGRWLEALRAFEAGRVPERAVPRVDLEATDESVLRKGVDLAMLRRFAIDRAGERLGGSGLIEEEKVNGNQKGEL